MEAWLITWDEAGHDNIDRFVTVLPDGYESGIEERINLQRDGRNAKPYQVKQVRAVILKYNLAGNDE